MSTTIDQSTVYKTLRDKAEAQLQAGTTPTTGHWSMGVDALRLLHQLSGDPEKAQDAIKLLHELQVHQVELDLQNEAIVANEHALAEDLVLYQTLYECAPLAYCVVKADGAVVQGNRAATELFDVAQDDLPGQRIDTLVKQKNRQPLLELLQRVAQSGSSDSCVAETVAGAAGGSRRLQFLASAPVGSGQILLACCPCAAVE